MILFYIAWTGIGFTPPTVFDDEFSIGLEFKHDPLFRNVKPAAIQIQHRSINTHLASRFSYIRG